MSVRIFITAVDVRV